MQRLSDTLVLSATDISDHLACPHLLQQRIAVARGERARPPKDESPHADLVRERGDAHEREQLELMAAEHGGVVDLTAEDWPHSVADLEREAGRAEAAMRQGAALIFQATLFDGTWQGRTDFLRRVDGVASELGDYAYEVLDTKLARQVTPKMVHQLSLYDRLLARVQGVSVGHAAIVLGTGHEETVDLTDYGAVHRRVVGRVEHLAGAPARETYPEPVAHCAICAFSRECSTRRRDDDHLSLVANARRSQRDVLESDAKITTVAALAAAPATPAPGKLGEERFDLLRNQADLQVQSRDTQEPRRRHLVPLRRAGYAALPPASPGDVFFDLEGDPYVGTEGGIEYLWGWHVDDGEYEHVWSHDPEAEKAALERFVDRVGELRAEHPDLHVFHYAPHERSKLRSLAVQYATREDEVDQLLRDGVLVDLYAVVRHALQVGEESYSLKALERHHGFVREERSVRGGGGSIVMYEEWLRAAAAERLAAAREGREPGLEAAPDARSPRLEAIRAYNEEDCRSTKSLRDWLLGPMRAEAAAEHGADFDELAEPEKDEPPRSTPEWLLEAQPLIDELQAGLPVDATEDDEEQRVRRLAAHLVLYHHRDAKPGWWRYFDLRGQTMDELYDDAEAIAGVGLDESVPAVPDKRSLIHTYRFPDQETKLGPGALDDPFSGLAHNVVEVGERLLRIRLTKSKPPPRPTALVRKADPLTKVLRVAVTELARSIHDGERRYPAAEALLRREPPTLLSGELGESVQELIGATLGLHESVLPVQGPPGTGKTYRGARMIVAALRRGLRVGVTAFSHAAIQNLLEAVDQHAHEEGVALDGTYKAQGGSTWAAPHGGIETVFDNDDAAGGQLVAGTAWLFARGEHRQAFDLLFVDEAGQYAMVNAAAVAMAAKSVVLLGDPQQLPQVSQAEHPDGSGASALEHLLDGDPIVRPGRGVLLRESWRMHPDVCAFVSEHSYEGELGAREACGRRGVDCGVPELSGAGLRTLPVPHAGRTQRSEEEASAIARACRALLAGGRVTDEEGAERELAVEDLLVVAPFNLARRLIAERVPDGVQVGTVDKFQGREAPVVFYALTCSTGEDVPRGLDFLLDRHRLNVAVSRAQCLAVLVHSPELLDADARSLPQMRLLDGVCRFVEATRNVQLPPAPTDVAPSAAGSDVAPQEERSNTFVHDFDYVSGPRVVYPDRARWPEDEDADGNPLPGVERDV